MTSHPKSPRTTGNEAATHSLYARAILGDPGAVSRVYYMFVVKVYCKIETSELPLSALLYANLRLLLACSRPAHTVQFPPVLHVQPLYAIHSCSHNRGTRHSLSLRTYTYINEDYANNILSFNLNNLRIQKCNQPSLTSPCQMAI